MTLRWFGNSAPADVNVCRSCRPLVRGVGRWSGPSGRLWGSPAGPQTSGSGLTRLVTSPWRGSGPSDPCLSENIGRSRAGIKPKLLISQGSFRGIACADGQQLGCQLLKADDQHSSCQGRTSGETAGRAVADWQSRCQGIAWAGSPLQSVSRPGSHTVGVKTWSQDKPSEVSFRFAEGGDFRNFHQS